MTKGDLINAVAKAAKVSKRAAGDAVDKTFSSVAKSIKKDISWNDETTKTELKLLLG